MRVGFVVLFVGSLDRACMFAVAIVLCLPFVVRSSCPAPVVPNRSNHGAEETCLAQEGRREEGRQEEGQAVGQAQREEARVEAQFAQAQVQEGRR